MQKPGSAANPLVTSVIHKPFARGVGEIGLPEFPEVTLTKQLATHLVDIGSPIAEREREVAKLAQSVMRGEVMGVEMEDDGSPSFFVRGGVGQTGVSVRLTCRNRAWRVASVGSLYTLPIRHSPVLMRSMWGAAVVVAAVIGFSVHAPLEHLVPALSGVSAAAAEAPATNTAGVSQGTLAGNQAANPGSIGANAGGQPSSTLANSGASGVVQSANGNAGSTKGGASGSATSNKASSKTGANTTHSTSKTVTYDLKPGTSLYALAQFLQSQHLVANAEIFDLSIKHAGIDRNVHPGTYVFPRGGTTKQLLAVLKKGPK